MSDADNVWKRRTDDELIEAAEQLEEYTAEGHRVIRAELQRRGIDRTPAASEIRTVESSALDNLASLGDRVAGQILDSLVVVGIILISSVPFALSDSIGGITFLVGLLCALFYMLLADGFQDGQSYGKRFVKTAVVDATTGTPCSFGQSFVRNVLLLALGVIDWLFIFGRRRQRLGDKAANTVVVYTPRKGNGNS